MDLSHPQRPGIQPAPLRVTTFNTQNGTETSLTTIEDGDTVISTAEAVDGEPRLFFRQRTAEAP